jgi:hypothetical protein
VFSDQVADPGVTAVTRGTLAPGQQEGQLTDQVPDFCQDSHVKHEAGDTDPPGAPGQLDRDRRRLAVEFAMVAAWMISPLVAGYAVYIALWQGGLGLDTHAYWLAGRSDHPYSAGPGERDAFLYSPVFALAMKPLALLPWPAFLTLWMVGEAAAFVWVTAPLALRWRIPVLLVCVTELMIGNVTGFLAVAIVLGLRWPGLWALPLLTKVTPGFLGGVWFLVRGEWSKLARLTGWTLGLALVSWLAAPHLWREWIEFLLDNGSGGAAWSPLIRLGMALALVAMAGRTNRSWLLPPAALLALPHATGKIQDFVILTSNARLPRRCARQDEGVG